MNMCHCQDGTNRQEVRIRVFEELIMKTRFLGPLCAIVVVATTNTPLIHAAAFTGLGGLPNGAFIASKALGSSGNGLVVVGYSDSRSSSGETPRKAFRRMQNPTTLVRRGSTPLYINNVPL